MDFQWTKKDLLSLYDLSRDEILHILNTAEEFKKVSQRNVKKVPALRGRTVVNLFVEPSTRTRVSFELAEQRLSADIINMNADVSSFRKGETLLDTLKNIQALQADIVVIRHQATGAPNFLARELNMGVVNAGDGAHSHPTQALLDIFTMREKKGRIEGLNVVIVGDILHSRVARSDIWGMRRMGIEVHLAGPGTMLPRFLSEEPGIFVHERVEDANLLRNVYQAARADSRDILAALHPPVQRDARRLCKRQRSFIFQKNDALRNHAAGKLFILSVIQLHTFFLRYAGFPGLHPFSRTPEPALTPQAQLRPPATRRRLPAPRG